MAGSEALLASQINGGGCLAPPTPSAPASQLLSQTLASFDTGEKQTVYEKYHKELPESLAFRPSTIKGMVEGIGAFIKPERIPENPLEMGVMMRNGKLVRVNRDRRIGGSEWRTSAERANDFRRIPQTFSLN